MAQLQTITDDLGKQVEIINIDYTVGANGVNNSDDVKIIKALFHCVPRKDSAGFGNIGKAGWDVKYKDLPLANDATAWGVAELTASFQKYANKMLSKYGFTVNVSGRMKPSKGFAVVGRNYSTIAALNVFANLGGTYKGTTYIERLLTAYGDTFTYLVNPSINDSDD